MLINYYYYAQQPFTPNENVLESAAASFLCHIVV